MIIFGTLPHYQQGEILAIARQRRLLILPDIGIDPHAQDDNWRMTENPHAAWEALNITRMILFMEETEGMMHPGEVVVHPVAYVAGRPASPVEIVGGPSAGDGSINTSVEDVDDNERGAPSEDDALRNETREEQVRSAQEREWRALVRAGAFQPGIDHYLAPFTPIE